MNNSLDLADKYVMGLTDEEKEELKKLNQDDCTYNTILFGYRNNGLPTHHAIEMSQASVLGIPLITNNRAEFLSVRQPDMIEKINTREGYVAIRPISSKTAKEIIDNQKNLPYLQTDEQITDSEEYARNF